MAEVKEAPVLVVMAAGMGSRFGGLKQIEDVDGRGHALIDYAVYDAALAGFEEVVFIIREEIAEDFKKIVGNRIAEKLPVKYVYQALDMIPDGVSVPEGRNKPWGTTHAIWCCREVLRGRSFLTVNADDFYGREAFIDAVKFFEEDGPDNEFGIIGYNVVGTLNEKFTVSRGICSVDENSYLKRIDERKEIKLEAGRGYFTLDGGVTYTIIPSDAVASMNLWAFRPAFMEDLITNYENRLKAGILQNPLKYEETLSDAVQSILERKECTVKVVNTSAKWFGMTYREDIPQVKAELDSLTEAGVYPGGNW
ncbi:MAG: nucleotidyltransferase [Eubacterium sp.]|nr:nucleotidyltransferase [Eubacterium sp.]